MSDTFENTEQNTLEESQRLVEMNGQKISYENFEKKKSVIDSSKDMKLIQEGPNKFKTRLYG
jgi:hypothetical protein